MAMKIYSRADVLAKVLFVFIALNIVGCTSIAQKGAVANDEAVSTSVWTICYGASIGSIRRYFSGNFDVWKALCPSGEIDME